MSPFKIAAFSTTALLSTTALASATVYYESEIVTASYGPAYTDWGTSSTSSTYTPTHTLNVAGFNSALGTLLGATVTLTETSTGNVDVKNAAPAGSPATEGAQILTTVKAILPGVPTGSHPTYSKEVVVDSTPAVSKTLDPGQSSGKQAESGSGTTSFVIARGSLHFYTSAWTASVGDLSQVIISSSNNNGQATFTNLGAVKLSIDYSYSTTKPPSSPPPVPEPATLGLLGAGMAGLGVLRRRSKR
jgi:hypothetical protein